MQKIPFEEATAPQLREYASTILGIDGITQMMNVPTLKARIRAVKGEDLTEIELPDSASSLNDSKGDHTAAPAIPPAATPVEQTSAFKLANPNAAPHSHHNDPRVEIRIAIKEEKGGDRDVIVPVNGVNFIIQRNKWVEVPYRVYEALNNAVQTTYDPVPDGDTGRIQAVPRELYAYDFSTKRLPRDEEVAAWREITDKVEGC